MDPTPLGEEPPANAPSKCVVLLCVLAEKGSRHTHCVQYFCWPQCDWPNLNPCANFIASPKNIWVEVRIFVQSCLPHLAVCLQNHKISHDILNARSYFANALALYPSHIHSHDANFRVLVTLCTYVSPLAVSQSSLECVLVEEKYICSVYCNSFFWFKPWKNKYWLTEMYRSIDRLQQSVQRPQRFQHWCYRSLPMIIWNDRALECVWEMQQPVQGRNSPKNCGNVFTAFPLRTRIVVRSEGAECAREG